MRYQISCGSKRHRIEIDKTVNFTKAENILVDSEPCLVQIVEQTKNGEISDAVINNKALSIKIRKRADGFPYKIIINGNAYPVEVERIESTRYKPPIPKKEIDGRVTATLPGIIRKLLVNKGDKVKKGQSLLVLEAMKMENEITAPRDGKVTKIEVEINQLVAKNHPLITIENK